MRKGQKVSEETKKLISQKTKEAMKIVMADKSKRAKVLKGLSKGCAKGHPFWGGTSCFKPGKLHPNWKGGTSRPGYSSAFYHARKIILIRDNKTCRECGKTKGKIEVHHIDYDRNNNNVNNLICLCRSCHAKTNYKRKEWTLYYRRKYDNRIPTTPIQPATTEGKEGMGIPCPACYGSTTLP